MLILVLLLKFTSFVYAVDLSKTEGGICDECTSGRSSDQLQQLKIKTCEAEMDANFCGSFFEKNKIPQNKRRNCKDEATVHDKDIETFLNIRDYAGACVHGFGEILWDVVTLPFILGETDKLSLEEFSKQQMLKNCTTAECKYRLIGPYKYLFEPKEIEGVKNSKVDCRDIVNKNLCYGYSAAVLYKKLAENLRKQIKEKKMAEPWVIPWSGETFSEAEDKKAKAAEEKKKNRKSVVEMTTDLMVEWDIRINCYDRYYRNQLRCYGFFSIADPVTAAAWAGRAKKLAGLIKQARNEEVLAEVAHSAAIPKTKSPPLTTKEPEIKPPIELKPPKVTAPKNAFEKIFPLVKDRNTFAKEIQTRRAEWNASHPNDLNNFPMPENKPAIDWIRSKLTEFKNNPGKAFRDPVAQKLNQKAHQKLVNELISELESVEKRGYPNKDTIHFVDRFTGLHTEGPLVLPDRFREGLNHSFQVKISSKHDKLLKEKFEAAANTSGAKRTQKIKEYEDALIETMQKELDEKGIKADVRMEFRNQQWRPHISVRGNEELNKGIEEQAVILSAHSDSDRTIAEGKLFKIHVAAVTDETGYIDGSFKDPQRIYRHDFQHIALFEYDPMTRAMASLPIETKQQILDKIDAISDAHKKSLAEFGLLIDTNEGPRLMFFTNNNELHKVKSVSPEEFKLHLKAVYNHVKSKKLSDEDAEWLYNWMKTNLPVHFD